MNPELQLRIAAIKAECEEILRIEKSVVPNQWSVVPGRCGGRYHSMVVSGGNDPTFVLEGYRDDCEFICKARNVSPAMARVVLWAIDQYERGEFNDAIATELANQWEGK